MPPQGITCIPCPRTALSDINDVSPVGTCRLDIAPVQCTSGVVCVNSCGLDLPPKLERGMRTAVKMMGNTSCLRHLQKYRPGVHFDLPLKCWDFHTAAESTRITVGRLQRESFSNSPGTLPLACRSTITDPRHRQGRAPPRPRGAPASRGGVHIARNPRN